MATNGVHIQVNLTGQTAIVTGASRGIGRGIAQALARSGATVACLARNVEKLAETVNSIQEAGGKAVAYPCDVTKAADINALVDQIAETNGGLQILVNNAGITRDTLLMRMADDQWDDVIATNLRGPFLFTRAACRTMVQGRYGRIINISSVSGIMGNPGQTNYSASKAGLIGFTKSTARELASRKITVNVVAPGFVTTEMTEGIAGAVGDEIIKRIPAKRFGLVDDVSEAVLFLASPAASYITGVVLPVDGGMTC